MRSWWRRIIVVIAIAPPTRMATIGTSNPPKPMIESTNLIFPVSCSSLLVSCSSSPVRLPQSWSFLGDTIRIDATLDQRLPLTPGDQHLDQLPEGAYDHQHDRDQQDPGSPESTHQNEASHSKTPATGFSGGADRDRTGGLLVANQALSQLSYSPKLQSFNVARFQSLKAKAFETLKL